MYLHLNEKTRYKECLELIFCITYFKEEFKRGFDVTVMLDEERAKQRLNCDCHVYNHQILLSFTDSKCQAQMLDCRQYRHRGTSGTKETVAQGDRRY